MNMKTIGQLTDNELVDTLQQLEARGAFRQCIEAMQLGCAPHPADSNAADEALAELIDYEPGDVIEGYTDLKHEAELRGLVWHSGEGWGLDMGLALFEELTA